MTDYNIDFKDHVVEYPNRFRQVQVSPGIVDLIPLWVENPAQVIQEGTPVNAELFDKLRANVTRRSETFAATAGQTVFNLTKAYLVDQGRIDVYISGIKQRSGVDFTETSPTSFTLSEGLDAGTIVEAVYFSASQALSEDLIEQVQAAEAATIAANEATANAIDATEGALTANLNWKEPVNNLTELNALSNPQIRDTRQTRDTGNVYRYDGNAWVLIQTMDPNAIMALDTRLTSQLADIALNVKMFGAKGDGVTDDSQAIKRAIEEILKTNPSDRFLKPALFFPPGVYVVKQDKIFSDFNFQSLGITSSTRGGITFKGVNRKSSIIKLVTEGNEKWFYDNVSINNQKFERLNFEHLGFDCDDPSKANGFKQWSQGGEKQFRFFSCDFNLARVMQFEGTGNADLNRFLMCFIKSHDYAFVFNNSQAVTTELITTDLHLLKGLVLLKNGGGGAFSANSGNVEMHPHPTETTDHYLFTMESNPALGQGNCDYSFTDLRFEMHGNNKKLVNTTSNDKPLNVNFTRCAFGTVNTSSREVVLVHPSKKVRFDNCILHDNFTYRVTGDYATVNSPSGAQLIFRDCDVGRSQNLPTRVTIDGNLGRVIATGCTRQAGATSPSIRVQDFDFGWKNAAAAGVTAVKKIAPIKQSWLSFPFGSTTTAVTLPPNCHVTRILIKKPAAPTSSASYELKVGKSDKTITLGASGLKPHNNEHVIDLKDLGEIGFTDLMLWAEGDSVAGQGGGIAYVEYI
jgi:hypothetical protein